MTTMTMRISMGHRRRNVTTTIMPFPHLLLNMFIFLWLSSPLLLLLGNNNNALIVVLAFNNRLIISRRNDDNNNNQFLPPSSPTIISHNHDEHYDGRSSSGSSSRYSSSYSYSSLSTTKLFVTSRKDTNDRRIQQRQESFTKKDRVIEQQKENDNLRDKIREFSSSLSSSSNAANSKPSYQSAADEATHALQQMFKLLKNNDVGEKEKLKSNKHRPRVDVIDCNMVINIWSKSSALSAASKSKSRGTNGQDQKKKDNNNNKYPPQQVMNILNGMIYIYKKYNYESIRPDVITYNSIINTYVKTKGTNFNDGPLQVFKLQINDYKEEHNLKSKPDIYTFSSMINACSKCDFILGGDENENNNNDDDHDDDTTHDPRTAAETAERYLDLANNWYEEGELKERPNMYNYRTVINCWIKASSKRRERRRRKDIDDDDDNDSPPQRAFNILQTMQIKYEQDEQKNNSNNNNSNSNRDDDDDDDAMRRPNTDMYNKVMNAYSENGDVDGTKKVYNMMTNDYYLQHNKYSKPNIQTYNILIGAWSSYCRRSSKSKSTSKSDSDSSTGGEQQLQNDDDDDDDDDYCNVDDDKITIDEAIIILKEVETIYNEIKKLYKTGYLKEGPNESTYTVLIKCLERYNGTEVRIQELKLLLSKKKKDTKEKNKKKKTRTMKRQKR